jgi:hypothetical protein
MSSLPSTVQNLHWLWIPQGCLPRLRRSWTRRTMYWWVLCRLLQFKSDLSSLPSRMPGLLWVNLKTMRRLSKFQGMYIYVFEQYSTTKKCLTGHLKGDTAVSFFLLNDKNCTKIVMNSRPSHQKKTNIFPRNNSDRSNATSETWNRNFSWSKHTSSYP